MADHRQLPTRSTPWQWRPLVPFLHLVILVAIGMLGSFSWVTILGVGVVGLWFVLAVVNVLVKGRFVRWLYSD